MATFLFNVTNATNDPTKATLPFIGAAGALENGDHPQVMLLGEGAYLAKADVANSIQGVGLPPLSQLLSRIVEHQVPVYVWIPCAGARGVSDEDLATIKGQLIDGVEWAKLIADADQVVTI